MDNAPSPLDLRRAPDDVPCSIDLRRALDARTWAFEADWLRPHRGELRARIAERVTSAPRILELGCGPGLLAEEILEGAPLAAYTLLDFSRPMLRIARRRVGGYPYTTFALADFIEPTWADDLEAPFDAIVTMQAVHELRHKRRRPALYARVHELLAPGGVFVVCDHTPRDERPLLSTLAEQQEALAGAGLVDIEILAEIDGIYACCASRSR